MSQKITLVVSLAALFLTSNIANAHGHRGGGMGRGGNRGCGGYSNSMRHHSSAGAAFGHGMRNALGGLLGFGAYSNFYGNNNYNDPRYSRYSNYTGYYNYSNSNCAANYRPYGCEALSMNKCDYFNDACYWNYNLGACRAR